MTVTHKYTFIASNEEPITQEGHTLYQEYLDSGKILSSYVNSDPIDDGNFTISGEVVFLDQASKDEYLTLIEDYVTKVRNS
jgi:hypothetical protein